jgi:cytochrome d ubiquinol oxidase subunit II
MSDTMITYLAAGVALLGLMAYAVLGGADFGGGVWDLLAAGPRKGRQREAIARAMGPVWEANHVWLIFVLVVLFTCFPRGYAALVTALFVPLHLVLLGIVLRGAAFVFRGYGPSGRRPEGAATDALGNRQWWGAVFGAASVVSPLLLGASFGVVTTGHVRVDAAGAVRIEHPVSWLSAYPLACGFLALSTCAYLAAVYLVVESAGELRADFRRRAVISGTVTAGLAALVLVVARQRAGWFFAQLWSPWVWPVLLAGGMCFVGSAAAVFGRRDRLARVLAAGQTVLMLLGWGLAHREYLIYPDVRALEARGSIATMRFLLGSLPVGLAALVPSLWLLFRVFKGTGGSSSARGG